MSHFDSFYFIFFQHYDNFANKVNHFFPHSCSKRLSKNFIDSFCFIVLMVIPFLFFLFLQFAFLILRLPNQGGFTHET